VGGHSANQGDGDDARTGSDIQGISGIDDLKAIVVSGLGQDNGIGIVLVIGDRNGRDAVAAGKLQTDDDAISALCAIGESQGVTVGSAALSVGGAGALNESGRAGRGWSGSNGDGCAGRFGGVGYRSGGETDGSG